MFKQILVPLDGSQLAETALRVAVNLAQQLGATVTLFHVVEFNAPTSVHGEPHLTAPDAARAYLADVTARMLPPSVVVEQHVHGSPAIDVAQSIVAHTEELHADLIIMCSHGGHSLQKQLFGSIAQKVIALNTTPVLLVNPEQANLFFHGQRLLVALDGDPEHEQGLAAAVELAQQCQAQLDLVMVIPTPGTLSPLQFATGRLLPQATAALLDSLEQGALEYLHGKRADLHRTGVAITCEVQRGDPVAALLSTAAVVDADLIVLGTHGKMHLDAFWSGSVTPRLVGQSRWPLLLVPVRQTV